MVLTTYLVEFQLKLEGLGGWETTTALLSKMEGVRRSIEALSDIADGAYGLVRALHCL